MFNNNNNNKNNNKGGLLNLALTVVEYGAKLAVVSFVGAVSTGFVADKIGLQKTEIELDNQLNNNKKNSWF